MLEGTLLQGGFFSSPRAVVLSNPGELSLGLLGKESTAESSLASYNMPSLQLNHFCTEPEPLGLAHTGCTPSKAMSTSSTPRLEKTDTPGKLRLGETAG